MLGTARQFDICLTQREDHTMSRAQLALNVDNLDGAVTFYSKLFNTEPAKVKPGYANLRSPSLR